MDTFIWTLILVASLAIAAAASQVFAAKAEEGAKASRLSPFFWGATLMVFGVSLPELLISIVASAKAYSSVVPAYSLGANLVNLLLITGLCAWGVKNFSAQKESTLKQIPLLLASSFLMIVLAFDGSIDRIEGGVLLLAFVLFLFARYNDAKQGILETVAQLFNMNRWTLPLALTLLLSGAVLGVGAYFVLISLAEISELQNWLPSVLGGSVVALGVSAPEMALAYRAAKKGNSDSVIALISASTILNSTLVLAIPALVGSLNVTSDVLTLALPFLLLALILFAFSTLQRKWSTIEGIFLILLYLVFLFQFLNPLFS